MSNYRFVSEAHASYLRDRAVTAEVANARGYRTISDAKDLESHGFPRKTSLPALLIPGFDVRGNPAPPQLRLDSPLDPKKRYLVPKGAPNHIDAHLSLTRKRPNPRQLTPEDPIELPPPIADPAVPLWATEGIPKADAAIGVGLVCISMTGVFSWRGKNEAGGVQALPDWEYIPLKGRRIYLAFDSDAMQKREVWQALHRLKLFLESRGAEVFVVYLPADEHGGKRGLDDYIAYLKSERLNDEQIRSALLGLASPELRGREQCTGTWPYKETPDGLVLLKTVQKQEIEIPLTNFRARIVTDITLDDGAETQRSMKIEAHLGGATNTITIPTTEFFQMRWPAKCFGSRAIVWAGQGTADHARCAIQMLSSDAVEGTIYTHTGWRLIGGVWVYLDGQGAIGAAGRVRDIQTQLPDQLQHCELIVPYDAESARAAVRATLGLLDLGPDVVTVPGVGVIAAAILHDSDFSIFMVGRTGIFKTEFGALIQQHWGVKFDSRNVPASFRSTANFNELLAFSAKDMVLLVDEFKPTGPAADRARMQRDAEVLLRGKGNAAGRGRLRSDASARPAKSPRGLIFGTGEELPHGPSLRARMWIVDLKDGDLDQRKLTEAQSKAALYPQSTASFIQWIAPLRAQLGIDRTAAFRKLRADAESSGGHWRTSDIAAQLAWAWTIFLDFAEDLGAIDADKRSAIDTRVENALDEGARAGRNFQGEDDPSLRFIELIRAALMSGDAHLTDARGDCPAGEWGWRLMGPIDKQYYAPLGACIGWVENDDVYLNADTAYRAATRMASNGNGLDVGTKTLHKRLAEAGLLRSRDGTRDTHTVRKVYGGGRSEFLHLARATLAPPDDGASDGTDDHVDDDGVDDAGDEAREA